MEKDTLAELRDSIEEKVSCLILSGLILELLILVIMVVFEYDKEDSIDFFYLFSVIYLMLATIYFAWASVVKENALELISFLIISTLLTTHAALEVLASGKITFLHWIALITYASVQALYYICFFFAYWRFSWRTASEINAVNPRVIRIFKLYQHFVSLVKLDLIQYCIIVFIYLFAIFVDWNFFHIGGIILGACCLILICVWAKLGFSCVFDI
jgi:hypothetical protein